MKHSVCIICMLFLGGIAAAQSKVVTNFDSILVDSNHMAIVKSEVITVVFANGTDSGVAHTKTVYVNNQEALVPHELTNTDAVNLVTGKVSEVVYYDEYWETNLSFWEQIIQPWNIQVRRDNKRYTLTQDTHGFFVPGPEEFTTKTPGTNWLFVGLMIIASILIIEIFFFPKRPRPFVPYANPGVFSIIIVLLYVLSYCILVIAIGFFLLGLKWILASTIWQITIIGLAYLIRHGIHTIKKHQNDVNQTKLVSL